MSGTASPKGPSDNEDIVPNDSVLSTDGLRRSDLDARSSSSGLEFVEGGSSEGDDDDLYEVKREPYCAFVPKIFHWGADIVCGEARTATKAVTGFPSWSKQYGQDTFHFYRHNPRILYDEIISGFTVAIMQVPESIAFSFVAGKEEQFLLKLLLSLCTRIQSSHTSSRRNLIYFSCSRDPNIHMER